MEVLTTTVPLMTDQGASAFRVSEMVLNVEAAILMIRLRESNGGGAFVTNGRQVVVTYTDAEATALMQALNTANLAVKSLQRRVLEKLQLDGKLPAGTIAGTP